MCLFLNVAPIIVYLKNKNAIKMKFKKLHITIFSIFIWSFSFAQQYTNYSIKEGLPSNHVYRITQDFKGFIWIITDKGISKFDGKTFKNFTIKDGLPSNDIWDIRITLDNKIWYFSKANKLGYIENDKVFAFPSEENKVMYPRVVLQAKNTIAFDDGDSFYTFKDSLWKKNKNKDPYKKYFEKRRVLHNEILFHSLNKREDSLIFHKKNTTIKFKIRKRTKDDTARKDGQLNDSLYFFINEHQYTIENLNSKKITEIYFSSQNLPKRITHPRFHLVNHQIQVTGMNFVSYLSKKGTLKNKIHIPEKLDAHFSFIDKTGNIWSATFSNGIFIFPKEKQQIKIVGAYKRIQQVKLIKNKVFASIYKEGFFKISDTLSPIIKNNDFQYSISDVKSLNVTIFSSEFDIYSYKNDEILKFNLAKTTLGKNSFARKLIEFKGFLYGNNSFGISKINSDDFTKEKEYRLYGVSSFSKTRSQLFIGNQTGLLTLKNDSIIKLKGDPFFNKPILSQANLNSKFIVVGTDGFGAYVTDGKTALFIDKSKNISIQNIFIDTNKDIWFATQNGVYKATESNNKYSITKSFFESDGLISNNTNSVVRKNDSLYVATDLGLSILNLNQKKTNQLQSLYIKSIRANNKNYSTDSISIPYNKNNYVSVFFGAINYTNQHNLTFQYKLKPFQDEWIKTSTQEINFTDLKPNTYHLKLKVSNHRKDEKLKTIVIRITPLWYQTLLFKVLIALFLLIIILIFNKWNKNKIEKKSIQKAEIQQKLAEQELYALRSQMNPHFVFNSLNAIQYFITKNEIDLSEKYLVKFAQLIRIFFDNSSKKYLTLENEVDLLKRYLEIEKMRFGTDFHYKFEIDKKLNNNTLIPTMLLQPIVENAVNHGIFHNNRIGNLLISFIYIDSNSFKVSVIDDGIGIKKSQKIKANSLKKHNSKSTFIINDRLQLLNQSKEWVVSMKTIDLTENDKTGTKVNLTFKKIK